MREYIRNITKTNDLILNGTLGNDEIDRFSKADYRWADNKRRKCLSWITCFGFFMKVTERPE